jgi:type II secretory ATPase GspE/PulE/Tfp pilus assembly ATPase PilB-like protein
MEHYAVEKVNQLLCNAIAQGASDIHIEPTPQGARVRMRFDGMLIVVDSIEQVFVEQLIARFKVLGGMNVAQKRLAQDGKYVYKWNERTVDVRLSSFPCVLGEKLVVRILDATTKIIGLDSIGLTESLREQLKLSLKMPSGLFIVTGPTGSGKTTTLYAMLQYLNNESLNIVTLEDPVEYTLSGVIQTQVNVEVGFTFEAGMRALLRQDPDVIFIGEIRDRQTAKTAIEAAMTGHLVFTTMHTVDALSAVMRLVQMGIEPYLIESALTGVIAQRLVRLLCSSCKKSEPLSAIDEHLLHTFFNIVPSHVWCKQGCTECKMTGYKGRVGIFEYRAMNNSLKEAVMRGARTEELYAICQKDGIDTLKSAAKAMIEQGMTTVQECMRVITLS